MNSNHVGFILIGMIALSVLSTKLINDNVASISAELHEEWNFND